MKRLAIIVLLINLAFNTQASIPEGMPQAVYDGIVAQVMTDEGHYDAILVEQAISQWLLEQPLPDSDGVLTDTGDCSDCEADAQGTIAELPQPRNVKIKAKQKNNGSFTTTYKIKWKRPKALASDSPYAFSHYNVFVSKDGASYETFEVTPKIKRNGRPKKKNKIKFKDSQEGTYTVQVQAVYVESSAAINKSSNNTQQSVEYFNSGWTNQKLYSLEFGDLFVSSLSGALKTCINLAGYTDNTHLKVFTKIDCRNSALIDSDIAQIEDFYNLRSLIIDDNTAVTDISPLKNLPYLTLLSLEGNTSINFDFSKIVELEDLYLGRMGLTALPDLNDMVDLEFLDLSDNQIASGFGKLPDNITVLNLENNSVASCNEIASTGKSVETIKTTATNNSFSDCAAINGIKYLNIDGGEFSDKDQEMTSFTMGLCGLSVANTNLEKILDSTPAGQNGIALQHLNLQSNLNLKKVNSIRFNVNGVIKRPHSINVSEDSKKLLCSNRFEMADYSGHIVSGNEIESGCGLTYAPITTNVPSQCKPNPVSTFDVYQNQESYKKYLKWEKNPNHDYNQWGVTGYKLTALRGNVIIAQRFLSPNTEQPYVLNGMDADGFKIKACIGINCGYKKKVVKPQFKQSLTRVTNLKVDWKDLQVDKTFKFSFNYPIGLIDSAIPESKPDSFKITPTSCFGTCPVIETIQYEDGANTNHWESGDYDYNSLPYGTSYNIAACNDELGCADIRNINISNPVTSSELNSEIPVNLYVSRNGYSFNLKWTVKDQEIDETGKLKLNNVDYFEIIEKQPTVYANTPGHNSIENNRAISPIKYYLDAKEVWKSADNVFSIILKRQTVGQYDIGIKSCKRDRINGDVCSNLGTGVGSNYPGYERFLFVPDAVLPNGQLSIQYSGNDTQIAGREIGIEPPNNIGWFEADEKKIISWTYPGTYSSDDETINYKPDYFYLTNVKKNLVGNEGCTVDNLRLDEFTISNADKIHDISNDTNVWTTQIKCSGLKDGTMWTVQACVNGAGCSPPAGDITFDEGSEQDEIYLMPTIPMPTNHSPGGPGDLLPGMWWNPELSGTGWHFYWANNLGLPTNHENYSNTYDLIGYWLSYREIRGKWTPTWFETRLKQVTTSETDPTSGEEVVRDFFEGDITYHEGVNGKIDVGNIKLLFNNGPVVIDGVEIETNRTAILQIDVDFEANHHNAAFEEGNIFSQLSDADDLGPYTSLDDGSLQLTIFDFAIGNLDTGNGNDFGDPNDSDHYSGLWQNKEKNVSILSWIEHGLEVMSIATLDDAGIPVWMMAVASRGPDEQTTGQYFEDYDNKGNSPNSLFNIGIVPVGFNPLSPKPEFHDFQGYQDGFVQYIGNTGRCFEMLNHSTSTNHMRFREAKFWANIDTTDYGKLIYEDADDFNNDTTYIRSITSMGSANADECVNDSEATSMLNLTKQASLHEIRFNIDSQDESDTICRPSVDKSCDISFTWYTDDYFQDIEPYVLISGQLEYTKLLDICSTETTLAEGEFVMENYQCTINEKGTYRFQLHKNKYDDSGTLAIAESETLEILECTDCVTNEDIIVKSDLPFIGLDSEPGGNNNGVLDLSDLPTAPDYSAKVGTTKGNFSVSPNGAANYSIPILTAPGSGGLVPSVSINYNSQSSRSALGKGWSVSGYSTISRCGQTFAQDYDPESPDPLVLGVNFSATDKFCVNGKRLFSKLGSYGAGGTTYVTEIDDFTKYTSYGDIGGSPECFIAQHKNGSSTQYGDCNESTDDDSAFVNAGLDSGIALMWAQSRMVDKKGNYYDNFYVSTLVGGLVEFYLDSIKFTSNLNLTNPSLDGEIKLNYSDLTEDEDGVELIIANQVTTNVISVFPHVKTINKKRLDSITSSYNGVTIRHYDLEYLNSDAAGFDLLTSVTECSDGNAIVGPTSCLESVEFNWGELDIGNVIGIQTSGNLDVYSLPSVPTDEQIIAGNFDANGDGLEDFYYSAANKIKIGLSIANSSNFKIIDGPNIGIIDHNIGIKTADVNADGFPDFIYLNNVYLWEGDLDGDGIYYKTVDLNSDPNNPLIGSGVYSQEFYDFNGDGLVDILEFKSGATTTEEPTLTIHTNRLDKIPYDPENDDIGDVLRAAFLIESPIIATIEIRDLYDGNGAIFNGGTSVSIIDFGKTTLKQVTDINSDGIPELILDIEVTLTCPSNTQYPCDTAVEKTLKTIAYLNEDNTSYTAQHLAGDSSCKICKKQITREMFIDVTGDGLPEFCYIELNTPINNPTTEIKQWKCHSELGDKSNASITGQNTIISFDVPDDTVSPGSIGFVDYQDMDGDGYLDFMYSYVDSFGEDSWYLNKNSWNNGSIVSSEWVRIPSFIAGNSNPGDNSIHQYVDINLFLDINNDGMIDHLNFDVQGQDPDDDIDGNLVKLRRSFGDINAADVNKEKIVKIIDGFSKTIYIDYKFMSDSLVYTRDTHSGAQWFDLYPNDPTNRLSPVYDFNSSMSLVFSYRTDLPAYFMNGDISSEPEEAQDFDQAYQYHYSKGKLQAGGRGFLGFKTVEIFNNNSEMLTETIYRQDFPYTGSVDQSNTYFMEGQTPQALREATDDLTTPCWVNGSCNSGIPLDDGNLTQDGILGHPDTGHRSAGNNGTLISSSNTDFNYIEFIVNSKKSYFIYPEESSTVKYDLNNQQIGSTMVATKFEEPSVTFYGNPTFITEYSYDLDNTYPSHTLKKTTEISYDYDDTGFVYSVNKPEIMEVTFIRPTSGDEVRKTTYGYDTNMLLQDETLTSNGRSLVKSYITRDDYGNSLKVGVYDATKNRISEKEYDYSGRYVDLSKIAEEIEQTVESRNKYGSPTKTINKQGISTFYSYDAFGKLYYQINTLGQYSQIKYVLGSYLGCAAGTAFYTETTSSGPTTWQCFDKLGREISTLTQGFDGANIIIHSHYDEQGRLLEKSSPSFDNPEPVGAVSFWQRFNYDALSRVTESKNPKGEIIETDYIYEFGELPIIKVTNALGKPTKTYKNILGEVTKVIDAKDNETSYQYDAKGNQTLINGPLGNDNIKTYYDGFDQVKKIEDPNLGTWNYKYNLLGELEYQRDAKGNCTVMTYDDVGRITSRSYFENNIDTPTNSACTTGGNGGSSIWEYYDLAGTHLYGLLDREYTQKIIKNYHYDELSRLSVTSTEITETGQIYSQYTFYDQYSRPLAQQDATDGSVKYEYNGLGYQTTITDQYTSTVYQNIQAIDAFGNIKRVIAGNEVDTEYSYDELGRVTRINTNSSSTNLQYLNYTYDAAGNLETRDDYRSASNNFKEFFTYDDINRLKNVEARSNDTSNYIETMELIYQDGVRLTKFNNETYHYSSGPTHGVNNVGVPGVEDDFQYDDNGNQFKSNGRDITYTAFNKASSIIKGSNEAHFEYDSNNARFKRVDYGSEGNETTYYIGNVEFITDNNGTTKSKRYIADAVITKNETTSGGDNSGLGNTVAYLHKDHLGSIQTVTNSNGGVISQLSYDAFGRRREMNNDNVFNYIPGNPIRGITKDGFTGQEHIDQLGIINFNARLYDPSLGIMLQADTIIPDGPVTQSMNRYSYVFNNPLSYTDPTGHVPLDGQPNQISEGWGGMEGASQAFGGFHITQGQGATQIDFFLDYLRNKNSQNKPAVSGVQNMCFSQGESKVFNFFDLNDILNAKKAVPAIPYITENNIESVFNNSVSEHGSVAGELDLSGGLIFKYITSGSKGFDKKVSDMLKNINKSESGNSMLIGIAESGTVTKIFEYLYNGNSTTAKEKPIMAFDPRFINSDIPFQDSGGNRGPTIFNPQFVLAHELFHIWNTSSTNPGFIGGGVFNLSGYEASAVRHTNQIRLELHYNIIRQKYMNDAGQGIVDRYKSVLRRIKE